MQLLLVINNSSCQNNSTDFDLFISKFKEVSLPINVSNTIGEVHFNEDNEPIDESEYRRFLKDKKNDNWPFSKGYSYKSSFAFKSNNILGLVYHRAFYPENILEEKSEYVLNVYLNGSLKSSMSIQGSYGDDESFFCQITNNLILVISRESFQMNEETGESSMKTSTEKYQLHADTGEIERL